MTGALWHLQDVTLTGANRPRLDNVSMHLPPGVTAIIGPSGAGKTSLLNLLVGFEKPDAGNIENNLGAQRDRLAVYWSPPAQGLWPHMNAQQHLRAVGATEREAADLLAEFDLAALAGSHPDRLSQGERSRLAVARALASKAAVLVMDEPLVHVDAARADRYWRTIREHVQANNASWIFSTHVPQAVLAEAQHVVCIHDGRVTYQGPVDELYWRPPTLQLALQLGEANWLSRDEAGLWLSGETAQAGCYRPQQLTLEPVTQSPLRVRGSRLAGAVADVELHHEQTRQTRRFLCRAPAKSLQAGDGVLLRLCLLMLAAMLSLTGCDGGSDPVLAVREVNYWSMPPDDRHIPAPRTVTIGQDDEVIVLDTAGRVLVMDAAGQLLRQWRMPDSAVGNPEGVCVLRDGRIAIADTHYSQVVFFSQSGELLGTFGKAGKGDGEFQYPVGLAEDDEGNLYVCEYGGENDRVQKFTAQGQWLASFGTFGTDSQQFQRPSGIVWHDGKVYVADAINNRIQVFHDDGRYANVLMPVGDAQPMRFPYDLCKGEDGSLYVIEYSGGRVTHLALDGRVLGRFGRPGSGERQFATPWGIAVDSQSRLRVADTGNRRMVELKL